MPDLLIIGKIPPPIGGVTVHVKRLIESLEEEGFRNFEFADLREGRLKCFFKMCRCRVVHLHISDPGWQLLLALFCRLTFRKLIITYHGTWGRYSFLGNWFVSCSAAICCIPIVQNETSLEKALRLNTRARLISTYLSSSRIEPLSKPLISTLTEFRKQYRTVVCTNAWNLTFDKNGSETYGISDLVTYVSKLPESGLIVSDPSAAYLSFLKTFIQIPQNVLFLPKPHDFRNVLHFADAFIRNTTTDGVSLSIHEALDLNVPVLASDVVERSPYCCVYHNLAELDLETAIRKAGEMLAGREVRNGSPRPVDKVIALYNALC